MPKQKTSSAARKRFKVSGAGKLLRRRAMQSHNFEKKSPKRKRRFGKDQPVDGGDAKTVERQLGLR
jgi:large subunit ribosomal protein L35